jgi:hypothetical protein
MGIAAGIERKIGRQIYEGVGAQSELQPVPALGEERMKGSRPARMPV